MTAVFTLETRATINQQDSIRRAMTLVVGVDGRVLHFVEWKRAISMVTARQAYVIETVKRRTATGELEDALVRSPSVRIPLPLIVGLLPHVSVPAIAFVHAKSEKAGRIAILRRDKKVCTYCGERGLTIDHIFPKSRGGRSTWQNLVAACGECNNRKADRTPEEAGLVMLFDPRVFEGGMADLQAEVWRHMDAACGVVA